MKEIKYPVDSANFQNIRERGFVYADKTEYIHKLTQVGTYYFLARPRRFGKSLFLDTLAEYFKGNRELFKGLAIDRLQPEQWDTYPVIRLNLSNTAYDSKDVLLAYLNSFISRYENLFKIEETNDSIYYRFEKLIRNVSEYTCKKVVVLIDEYDAPLSSSIDKPELQEVYREQLHGFYSVLKGTEEYIQFCMLTGVTRYGKVSVFSGLNNLNDISFDDQYAGICGITKDELSQYYEEGIAQFAEKKNISLEDAYNLLRFNYDGYHFSESLLDIYNPFSINHALNKQKIDDYWCKSGEPTILSKSLMENDFDVEKLNGKKVSQSSLTDLSIHNMNPVPLFYQTGYLTIKAYESRRQRYTLGYPNREVEAGILRNILKVYTHSAGDRQALIFDMEDAFEEGVPEKALKILSSFLSSIPTQLHKYVDKYENYYHSIFYCLVKLIGLDVQAEYSTSEGFIDILIKTEDYIYVIELKVNGTAEDAIKQIDEKQYAAPFASDKRRIYKIGIGFSIVSHSIESYIIE